MGKSFNSFKKVCTLVVCLFWWYFFSFKSVAAEQFDCVHFAHQHARLVGPSLTKIVDEDGFISDRDDDFLQYEITHIQNDLKNK